MRAGNVLFGFLRANDAATFVRLVRFGVGSESPAMRKMRKKSVGEILAISIRFLCLLSLSPTLSLDLCLTFARPILRFMTKHPLKCTPLITHLLALSSHTPAPPPLSTYAAVTLGRRSSSTSDSEDDVSDSAAKKRDMADGLQVKKEGKRQTGKGLEKCEEKRPRVDDHEIAGRGTDHDLRQISQRSGATGTRR